MVLVPQRGAAPARSPAVSYWKGNICIPVPPPLENLKEILADIGSFITEMKPALLQLVMACAGAPASTDAIFTILSRIYQKYLAKTQPRGAAPASDSPNSPSNPAIEILLLEEPPQVISSPELKIPEPAPDYSIPHPNDSPAMAAFRERWRVRKSSSDE